MANKQLPNFQYDMVLDTFLAEIERRRGFIEIVALDNLRDLPRIRIETLFVTPLLAESHVDPDSDIDNWPQGETLFSALGKNKRVVILGDPGSGKSTLSNWLAWRLSAGLTTPLPDFLADCLPIPCILRELPAELLQANSSLLTLTEYIVKNLLGDKFTAEVLENIQARITAKNCIFIFDGLDEVSSHAKETVRFWMQEAERQDLYAVATSRIIGYEDCPVDCAQIQMDKALLQPLGNEMPDNLAEITHRTALKQAKQTAENPWARKYFLMPFDNRRIEIFAQNWYQQRCSSSAEAKEKASDLFAALQRSQTTLCLARTPNLLALMAVIHRERADLPDGKALLYDEIANAYMNTIDQARKLPTGENELAKYSWKERKNWLAYIAFCMQKERTWNNDSNGVLVNEEKILAWLSEILGRSQVENSQAVSEQFLKWVAQRSGLLLPRGAGVYGFVHLSFQEYFCACYIKDRFVSAYYAKNGTTKEGEIDNEKLKEWAGENLWKEVFIFLLERLSSEVDDDWLDELYDCIVDDLDYPIKVAALSNRHIKKTPAIQKELLEKSKDYIFYSPEKLSGLESFGVLIDATEEQIEKINNPDQFWLISSSKLISTFCLAKFKNITHLRLNNQEVNCLSPLSESKNIQHLSLDNTQVSDISPLTECKYIEYLSLDNTQVSDISPLTECKSIQYLFLSDTQVSDISPLSECKNLQDLYLDNAQVSDLTPLVECKNIQYLYLNNTQVSDLSPLAECKNISFLRLDNTQVTDLSPLVKCGNIKYLLLSDAKVNDLSPLSECKNINFLRLDNTQVTDLSPLANLSNLRQLLISKNQNLDTSPLKHLKNLQIIQY